eukprot:scaffold27565_cov48-Phaeocystis_antarctica.AAC.2
MNQGVEAGCGAGPTVGPRPRLGQHIGRPPGLRLLYGLGGASRHVTRSEVRRPGRPLRASHTLPETCEHSPTSARLICNDRRSCAACASTTEGCNDMSDRLQPPAAHFIWRAFVGNH